MPDKLFGIGGQFPICWVVLALNVFDHFLHDHTGVVVHGSLLEEDCLYAPVTRVSPHLVHLF